MEKKIALISLDPVLGGGILASQKSLYFSLKKSGQVTLFFADFARGLGTSLRNLKFTASVQKLEIHGMQAVAIGSRFSFWEPWIYSNSLDLWEKELAGFDEFWVSSGTAIAGHPLFLLKKKYILWIASPFWEDREVRIKNAALGEKLLGWLTRPFLEKIEKNVLAGAAKILAMSNYAKAGLQKIVPEKKIDIYSFPITTNIDSNKKWEKNKNMVLSVGRFADPRKNLSMMLAAWKIVEQQNKDLFLVLAGGLTKEQEKEIKLHDRVFALGQVDEDEKIILLKKASLFLITSWQEGLCIAGLEAVSFGIHVIATNCGGVTDFVIPGKTGELVEINDSTGLAEKILTFSASRG